MNDKIIISPVDGKNHRSIIEQNFRFAEKIRSLDERTALKIALALAGHDKELFLALHEVAKSANMMPGPIQRQPESVPLKAE